VEPRHWVIPARRFERANWYHRQEFVTKEERKKNKYSSFVIYALEVDTITLSRNVWHQSSSDVAVTFHKNEDLSFNLAGIWLSTYGTSSSSKIDENDDGDDDDNNNNVKTKFISVTMGASGIIWKSFKQYIPVLAISVN
jgi:hypothetical protein